MELELIAKADLLGHNAQRLWDAAGSDVECENIVHSMRVHRMWVPADWSEQFPEGAGV